MQQPLALLYNLQIRKLKTVEAHQLDAVFVPLHEPTR